MVPWADLVEPDSGAKASFFRTRFLISNLKSQIPTALRRPTPCSRFRNSADRRNRNGRFAFSPLAEAAASMTRTSDDDRLAEWVRLHGEAVRGFILALVRRPDVADDLEQEVFCRAWEARGSYVEQGKSRAYLLKIADHLVCDRSRRPVLEKTLSDQQWIQCEPFSRVPDPPDAAVASELSGQLAAAMDRLPAIQQRVLLLRYYGQMSFLEIAEVIDCPLSTALSHCHRALKTLRNLLVEP